MNRFISALAVCCVGSLGLCAVTAAEHVPLSEGWTPASLAAALAAMPQGDIERGRQLNRDLMCASCHGDEGLAPTPNWPNVAGQKAAYTYKMLLDYQSGRRAEDRRSELMSAVSALMDARQMADIAVFYASLHPRKTSAARNAMDRQGSLAEALIRKGDRRRLITPCASCHGLYGQGGINAAPALAGQTVPAFIRTMQMYKTGKRTSDVNASMSQFSHQLTDDEIRQLAEYYADR